MHIRVPVVDTVIVNENRLDFQHAEESACCGSFIHISVVNVDHDERCIGGNIALDYQVKIESERTTYNVT